MKINYVISSWGGSRRASSGKYNFLKSQIEALNEVKHNLEFVTVAYCDNVDPSEDQSFEYFEYIDALKNGEIKTNFKVSLINRPNLGLSYGAFSDVYGIYRNCFEFYIFMEDDLVFIKDYFDEILVDLLEKRGPECAYLCGILRDVGTPNEHAGSSVGILRQSALEDLWQKHHMIPHQRKTSIQYISAHSQVIMSTGILEAGYKLSDIGPEYGCVTWWPNAEADLKGVPAEERAGEMLFLPTQLTKYYKPLECDPFF